MELVGLGARNDWTLGQQDLNTDSGIYCQFFIAELLFMHTMGINRNGK